jgi:hypothetical protein
MNRIGDWSAHRLSSPDDEAVERLVQTEVLEMTAAFPVPGVAEPVVA